MSEDYERRVRNLERAILAMDAILDGHIPKEANRAMANMGQAFFYSITNDTGLTDVEFEPPKEDETNAKN